MQPPATFSFLRQGKVRDLYGLDDGQHLLIVASDRISAFDHVLPNLIPEKGENLTRLSNFWFEQTRVLVPNHVVSTTPSLDGWIDDNRWRREELASRSILVRKAEPLPIEAIVRGYLVGSGWADYCRTGEVCGVPLPKGLVEAEQLPEPIFTPSTKAAVGAHDENISFEQAAQMVDLPLLEKVRDISLQLYAFASAYALQRGIIIADSKFEFGLIDGELTVIDELFTPDSSRFWPADSYQPGSVPSSFDKQYVRDYLVQMRWNKQPPVPTLPDEIVRKTTERYREAVNRLLQ